MPVASLTAAQIADFEATYRGPGRRHSPATPLGRMMYRAHMPVGRLAELCHIQRVTLSNYLCGDRPIRNRAHVDLFAHYLQCRVVDLISPSEARGFKITLPDDAEWFAGPWPFDPSRDGGVR